MRSLLDGDPSVRGVVVLERTGSTNDDLRQLADRGAPAGTVIVADAQNAARGRRGRVWFAASGLGVHLSVLFRPGGPGPQASRWTVAAAVAACESCRGAAGEEIGIKWPNDLLAGGRKVAGILTEIRSLGGRIRDVIVGVGVNVNHREEDFPGALRRRAGSLRMARKGIPLDREALAAALASALVRVGFRLEHGGWEEIRRRWLDLAPGADGRQVRVRCAEDGPMVPGTTRGLDGVGALRVERIDGTMVSIRDGEDVEWEEAGRCF